MTRRIPLPAEGLSGHAAEQREMRVLRDPVLVDPAAREHGGRAAGSLIGGAVLVKAARVPPRHAGGGEAVGRDDAADRSRPPAEPGDEGPDVAPLRRFDGVALDDEIAEGAEGDHCFGEERPRAGEIDVADTLGETLEPGGYAGEIVVVRGFRHWGWFPLDGVAILPLWVK